MDYFLIIFVIVLGLALALLLFSSPSGQAHQKKKQSLHAEFVAYASDIKSASRGELRDLIVRMDKTLADILRFYNGNEDTIGENLKLMRKKLEKHEMDKLWKYHKIRNRVVHDSLVADADTVYAMYNCYLTLINKLLG